MKMLIRNLLSFLCLLFIIESCTNKNVELYENVYGIPILLQEKIDSIAIDDSTLTSYNLFSLYEDSVGDYLYAYNSHFHSLDLLNLEDGNVSHLLLRREGQNGIGSNLYGMYVHNADSIWMYAQPFLYLLDRAGVVRKKIELPFPKQGFINLETNFSISTNRLFYHSGRKSIFYLCVTPTDESARYEAYEYDLSSGDVQSYLLKGGNLEKRSGQHFGWKQYPNVSYTDSLIVYNYPITSNIYVINLFTGEETIYGGQSRLTANRVSELSMPYDFERANRHLLENVHFFELLYDSKNRLYYRLHMGTVPYTSREEFHTLYKKKRMILMVFDSSFRIVDEVDLGSGVYNYFNCWGITGRGFFLARSPRKSDIQETMFVWSYFFPYSME